jgi:drug/metabolite transporter (DMT)-like permease
VTVKILGLILSCISLSAAGQILMKLGMASERVQAALTSTPFLMFITAVTSPSVLGGLFCYGLAAVLWLRVLAQIDLALAYPFVSLSFPLIMLAGHFFFGEHVGPLRIAGATLVALGVYLVAAS